MALLNPPSPESSERINLPSEKKSNSTESLLISAGFLLNAQTIAPVSLAGIVLPTVRSISLSAVPDGTVLPVPAMDALTGHRCRFNKYQYCPEDAHRDYRTTLIDSRQGVNLTVQEAKKLAAIIAPLLKQGHSPYRIVASHPELGICEKTLYNYIEGGVFREISDISVLDLRRQVSRKIPKKLSKGFKRESTDTIFRDVSTKTIKNTFLNIRKFLLHRWTPFITTFLTALLFRPFSFSSHGSFSASCMKKKLLLP